MAFVSSALAFAPSAVPAPGLPFWQRVVNAIVASRIRAAEDELRRHAALAGRRPPTLSAADLLPYRPDAPGRPSAPREYGVSR